MSYTMIVKVNAGTAVATLEGDVPDGEYIVSGYEEAAHGFTLIRVTQKDELGRYVIGAEHSHRLADLEHLVNRPR
jgi:hypothetical protein